MGTWRYLPARLHRKQTGSSWGHGGHGPQRHSTLPSWPWPVWIPDMPSMTATSLGCSLEARKLVRLLLSAPEGVQQGGTNIPTGELRALCPGGRWRWRSEDLNPSCQEQGLDSRLSTTCRGSLTQGFSQGWGYWGSTSLACLPMSICSPDIASQNLGDAGGYP